jgi:hypothetical protein
MKRWRLFGIIIVVGLISLAASGRTYFLSLNQVEPNISEATTGQENLCQGGGYFTTASGFGYCFIFDSSVKTYNEELVACNSYGRLAVLTDGEKKNDLLDIIYQFNISKSILTALTGIDPGGPLIADTCTQLTGVFPRNDGSLYAERGHPGVDCSANYLILEKAPEGNGRFNDTRGNGIFGAVCQFTTNPSPRPSSSPSSSPSPGASASPGSQAGFVIHKFLDANKNGIRETGEGPTNSAWEFEYQVTGSDKRTYTVDPGSDAGQKISAPVGSVVKVAELGQAGWLNTTGAEVTKTLSEARNYDIYFGNWPVGGVPLPSGTIGPAQPDTGAPTWLTVLFVSNIMFITVIKFIKFISHA